MDVDLSRLPNGASRWNALVDHALGLGDLSEVDWLELKGKLPFGERSDRKRSAVVLSRAILGMANRMPDVAGQHVGGHGVVLVGIDAQTIVGADEVDGAVLRDVIKPYVGEDGPLWDYVYLNHQDGLVMAVVVDPPSWGDAIHSCRKDYSDDASRLAVRDGDVFVRQPGKTQPATSHDLGRLQRRAARAPHSGADVRVNFEGTFDRVRPGSPRDAFEEYVNSIAEELLASVPQGRASASLTGVQAILAQQAVIGGSQQDQRQYRKEVEHWRAVSLGRLAAASIDFYRFTLARGRIRLRNTSDRYLEGVRVQVRFPSGVLVLMASDTDYCRHGDDDAPFQLSQLLPDRPSEFSQWNRYGNLTRGLVLPRHRPAALAPRVASTIFDVEDEGASPLLTWQVGDLPPRGLEVGDESFAVLTSEHLDEIVAGWTVTARGIDHVFAGELRLESGQHPGEHLGWGFGSGD